MLDAHAHVMQVKLCKANNRGVTPTSPPRFLGPTDRDLNHSTPALDFTVVASGMVAATLCRSLSLSCNRPR